MADLDFLIGPSEMSGIEIESEYQLMGHPVFSICPLYILAELFAREI